LNNSLSRLPAERIFVMDWGILETINLMSQGETPVTFGEMLDDATSAELAKDAQNVFVAHTPGNEIHPGAVGRLTSAAAREGYQKEILETIYDRNGRAIFEIFRFRNVR
jgi:hypothetical protein